MLIVLISAAQAQKAIRGVFREPRDRRDAQDRRDPRDRRDAQDRRDPRDRRDSQDRRDPRDQSDQRDGRDRGRERDRGETLLLLGERRVGTDVDVDTLRLGRDEAWFQRRNFRALHFFFDGNEVYFDFVKIKYLNGYEEPVQRIGRMIPPGGRYVLSFGAPVSFISEIEMKYLASDESSRGRAPATPRGPTTVKVYGAMVRQAQTGRDEWVKLDCDRVSILDADRHVIKVGRREGRFMAIRLHARYADIRVWDIKVYYANETSEEIDPWSYWSLIKAEQYSHELDLIGNQRSIDRIEFIGRSNLLPVDVVLREEKIRRPEVCVEGLQHLPAELLREAPPATR